MTGRPSACTDVTWTTRLRHAHFARPRYLDVHAMPMRCPCDIHGRVDPFEPDCARCVGLCCVALPFRPSHGFAFAKDAGEPCRHLGTAYGCRIHASLLEAGVCGCTASEGFGGGPHVTPGGFGGGAWRGGGGGGGGGVGG